MIPHLPISLIDWEGPAAHGWKMLIFLIFDGMITRNYVASRFYTRG